MSVDVFGRALNKSKESLQGPAGIGFTFTRNGNFNIENRKLCNVASAVELSDAVNLKDLKSVDEKVDKIVLEFKSLNTNVKKVENSLDKLLNILKKLEYIHAKSDPSNLHDTTIFATLEELSR